MRYPILNLAKLTLSIAALSLYSAGTFAMTALDDAELSEKSGQALLNLSTIMPGEQGNPNGNTGFYKVGLQAQLDLNANIRKLQLGCGGINGPDACDVDIDYLRFAGLASLNPDGTPVNNAGPNSDFQLVNPFIELAMSNPDSLVNRKLVGLRVGGEKVRGVLSIGTRPVDAQGRAVSSPITVGGVIQEDVSKHTGINSLSGSIGELIVDGVTQVDLNLNANIVEADITGRFDDDPDTLAPFTNVYSSRASQLRLAPLEIQDVEIGLLLGAGLDVTADFITDLKLIHNLVIANNGDFSEGFYISLSDMGDNIVNVKENGNRTITREAGGLPGQDDVVNNAPANASSWLKWQTTVNNNTTDANAPPEYASGWVAAQRGWSLRVPRIEISNFTTSPVEATIAAATATALVNNPDLGQVPIDNCFGGLSFC